MASKYQAIHGNDSNDETPMICETCLGSNPYVRMIKCPVGHKLCKLSAVPFQSYRWKAGSQGRYKETIISLIVAKERNLCQGCLKDMRYDLPAGVRDTILSQATTDNGQVIQMPQSEVGVAYYYQNQAIRGGDDLSNQSFALQLQQLPATNQLERFAASSSASALSTSYHTQHHNQHQPPPPPTPTAVPWRNLPKLCSFWLNGACTRVVKKSCPYRPCCGPSAYVFPEIAGTHREIHHQLQDDLKTHGPAYMMKHMSKEVKEVLRNSLKGVNREEAIRKRVNGDDDLSKKYINRMQQHAQPMQPPDDETITTIWLGSIEMDITEEDVTNATYAYGHVISTHIARASKCAFVEYASRDMAVYAMQQLYSSLMIKGRPIPVKWAKPRPISAGSSDASSTAATGDHHVILPPPGLENAPVSSYALGGNDDNKTKKRGIDHVDHHDDVEKKKRSLVLPSSDPMRLGASIE